MSKSVMIWAAREEKYGAKQRLMGDVLLNSPKGGNRRVTSERICSVP